MIRAQVRVGIVGAGANTRAQHIPRLQAIAGVGIVGVCNRTLESTSRVAREFGIPTLYDNWPELVRAPDTDAIVIGTWPYLHCPVTLMALEAGKHVLCEARMAMNAAEARAMLNAARLHPRQVAMLVPAPFTLRVDRTVQRLLAEGYVGRILGVEARVDSGFPDPAVPLHWREDADLSGMNVMSLGIWYESLLRWVGPATHVMAGGDTAVPPASRCGRHPACHSHCPITWMSSPGWPPAGNCTCRFPPSTAWPGRRRSSSSAATARCAWLRIDSMPAVAATPACRKC